MKFIIGTTLFALFIASCIWILANPTVIPLAVSIPWAMFCGVGITVIVYWDVGR